MTLITIKNSSTRIFLLLLAALFIGIFSGIYGPSFDFILIGLIICLVLVVIIYKEPGYGILLIFFSIAFDNIGFPVPIVGQMSIGKIAGLLFIIGGLLNFVTREKKNIKINRTYLFVLLFVIFGSLSFGWAADINLYNISIERIFFSVILFAIIPLVINNLKSISIINEHIWQVIGVVNLIVVIGYNLPIPAINSFFASGGRLSGGMGDPNEFALINVVLIPFLLSQFFTQKGLIHRIISWAFLLTSFIAIVQTQSRGGLIATILITIISVLVLQEKSKSKFTIITFGIIIIILYGVISLYPFVIERLALGNNLPDVLHNLIHSDARPTLWLIGLSIFRAHPILGIGLGNVKDPAIFQYFQSITQGFRSAETGVIHNGYIEVAAELGIIGLALYLLSLSSSIVNIARMARAWLPGNTSFPPLFLQTLLLVIIGFSITILLLSEQYAKIFWILIGLACSCNSIWLIKLKEIKCLKFQDTTNQK